MAGAEVHTQKDRHELCFIIWISGNSQLAFLTLFLEVHNCVELFYRPTETKRGRRLFILYSSHFQDSMAQPYGFPQILIRELFFLRKQFILRPEIIFFHSNS